ncbi:MAG TPA: hypothetical protein VHN77_08375 [Phycisphaerales bacterium]|nr:hypothetical protein [Phycisphaerales bacterium]
MNTARLIACIALAGLAVPARGQFQTFQGGASSHAAWLAAVDRPVPMETFEGFNGTPSPFAGPSDPVPALPALGIVLRSDIPNVYPGVYADAQWAHSGVDQLANFGAGLGNSSDYFIEPAPGLAIRALGFWQCDPQGNQTLYAYDGAGALVGSITGLINNGSGNSFAAFLSVTPIARVRVEGTLGDGWNHIDDLQVLTVPLCDAIDFNGDGLFPDTADIDDFLSVFSGGPCSTGTCGDIDFNNDGLYPDTTDIDSLLSVFSGGACF